MADINTYQAALAYLDQFADYEKTRSASYTPGTFNLARVEALLDRLDNPHRRYKTVHVAGTKGKGSVCAMLEAVLRAAGYRTGLYTSPHLHTFRERVQVGGTLVSRDELLALVRQLVPHVEAVPGLTTFEIVTALGLLHFAQRDVEVAVIEVGLGGRLDATNVIQPLVSVITSISFDHTAWLGNTLALIAAEKAGIVKAGVPLVSAPQPPEAAEVIEARCRDAHAPLTTIGRDWKLEFGQLSGGGQTFFVIPAKQHPPRKGTAQRVSFFVRLAGRYQAVNACVALAALSHLAAGGLPVSPRHMREGLARVHWPARLETLCSDPLVVCDGAHNGDSARQLVTALEEWFPGRQWTLVFGAMADKDVNAMLDACVPFAQHVVLTRACHARAADPNAWVEAVRRLGKEPQLTGSVSEALRLAMAQAGGQAHASRQAQAGVIATGSLAVAAEARAALASEPPETDD